MYGSSGPLYNADNEPAYACAGAGQTCWYPLKRCDDDTDAGVSVDGDRLSLTPDAEGGCPTMPELHIFDNGIHGCFYVEAGTAGTTDAPPASISIAANEIADCESCGTGGFPCECDVDGDTCIVEKITVTIAGSTINPACCPPSGGAFKHYECVNQGAANGTHDVYKHNGHGTILEGTNPTCYFRVEKDVSTVFRLLWNLGTPESPPPEEGVEGCDSPDETFTGIDLLRINATGPTGSVEVDLTSTIDSHSGNWDVDVLGFFAVNSIFGDFPCPDQTVGTIPAAGDGSGCAVGEGAGIHTAAFSLGNGTLTATATLNCNVEPLP